MNEGVHTCCCAGAFNGGGAGLSGGGLGASVACWRVRLRFEILEILSA